MEHYQLRGLFNQLIKAKEKKGLLSSLFGRTGILIITALGATATAYANEDETIIGTDEDDKVIAGRGDDTVYGGNGDDELLGLWGDDILYGEDGHDTLHGAWGEDILYGGDGHDTLYGAWGDDILYGGAGNDELSGAWGEDTLYGGDGNDKLDGVWGDDTLYGGAGNDYLYAGIGDNLLYGNDGDDKFYNRGVYNLFTGGDGDTNLFSGGDGYDSVYTSAHRGLVTISDGVFTTYRKFFDDRFVTYESLALLDGIERLVFDGSGVLNYNSGDYILDVSQGGAQTITAKGWNTDFGAVLDGADKIVLDNTTRNLAVTDGKVSGDFGLDISGSGFSDDNIIVEGEIRGDHFADLSEYEYSLIRNGETLTVGERDNITITDWSVDQTFTLSDISGGTVHSSATFVDLDGDGTAFETLQFSGDTIVSVSNNGRFDFREITGDGSAILRPTKAGAYDLPTGFAGFDGTGTRGALTYILDSNDVGATIKGYSSDDAISVKTGDAKTYRIEKDGSDTKIYTHSEGSATEVLLTTLLDYSGEVNISEELQEVDDSTDDDSVDNSVDNSVGNSVLESGKYNIFDLENRGDDWIIADRDSISLGSANMLNGGDIARAMVVNLSDEVVYEYYNTSEQVIRGNAYGVYYRNTDDEFLDTGDATGITAVYGGRRNDIFYASHTQSNEFYGNGSNDSFYALGGSASHHFIGGSGSYHRYYSIENSGSHTIIGGFGTDRFNAKDDSGDHTFYGHGGWDSFDVDGSSGSHTYISGDGPDSLSIRNFAGGSVDFVDYSIDDVIRISNEWNPQLAGYGGEYTYTFDNQVITFTASDGSGTFQVDINRDDIPAEGARIDGARPVEEYLFREIAIDFSSAGDGAKWEANGGDFTYYVDHKFYFVWIDEADAISSAQDLENAYGDGRFSVSEVDGNLLLAFANSEVELDAEEDFDADINANGDISFDEFASAIGSANLDFA